MTQLYIAGGALVLLVAVLAAVLWATGRQINGCSRWLHQIEARLRILEGRNDIDQHQN